MGWGWRGGRGWGWISPWPGRGPFSWLPPWLRPGWLFGRGACWWLFGPWMYPWLGYYGYYPMYYWWPWGTWSYPWYIMPWYPIRPW
ncbi:MAG: hypothetical protein DRN15_02040 [Thermoprotei archaeon]|nr:MAG: hypothetical protein DRN15_02040 [Thermoprotei archaeon]